MGLRVGAILGTLEGIWSAVAKREKLKSAPILEHGGVRIERETPAQTEAERLRALVIKARNELRTEGVFGKEYWGTDGIWTYEVKEGDGGWKDVVDAHPLIESWEKVVKTEVDRVALDTGVMEKTDVKRLGEDEEVVNRS
jgi:hypothetical protein